MKFSSAWSSAAPIEVQGLAVHQAGVTTRLAWAGQGRSALAAKTLLDMGFPEVATLAGGYASWCLAQKK